MHLDLDDLERQAAARLPGDVSDYFAGGAEREQTLAGNERSWADVRLLPRVLRDVSAVDVTTTVLGQRIATPVGVAPTAFQRLAHPDGECATAAGAARAGALHVLSTRATASPADVEEVAPAAPRWFQVYVLRDRAFTERLVLAAVAAGARALVLTADTPVLGRRLRDARNEFVLPANLGVSSLDFDEAGTDLADQDPSLTFDDISWLRDLTGLPVVVKGVLRPDDAERCVEAGAAAIWVSNHGGRQLDGAVATARALPGVVDAVGGEVEVYVDGGVRGGTDALRALALGARAVFLGRPILWGLAVAGADGVARVLGAITDELVHAMRLAGARRLDEVTRDLVAG